MSKLYKFEIIKPEIEDEGDGILIRDITAAGKLVDLYINDVKTEGKLVSATIIIEVEEEDD